MRPKITNDELVEAVEQEAEQKDITKTEAIRIAIRQVYVNGRIDEESNDPTTVNDVLDNEDMRSIHRSLWRMASSSGQTTHQDDLKQVPLSNAKCVIAQLMGVSKDVINNMYIKPLSRKQVIDIKFGVGDAVIYVVDPDASVRIDETDDDEVTNDDSGIDPDDRMEQLDNSEPVRADGGTKSRQQGDDDK